MIADETLYEIIGKATMGVFDAHEVGITGIESGAKEYAKRVAIDFFNYAKEHFIHVAGLEEGEVCIGVMEKYYIDNNYTTEQLFDLYLKSK